MLLFGKTVWFDLSQTSTVIALLPNEPEGSQANWFCKVVLVSERQAKYIEPVVNKIAVSGPDPVVKEALINWELFCIPEMSLHVDPVK
jgi:hypothetical protein